MDIAAVLAAIERDDSADFVLTRVDLYIALARAVAAERAAHAEIMANLESRTVPYGGLYRAHDVAAEAVESALAALALPAPEKPTP